MKKNMAGRFGMPAVLAGVLLIGGFILVSQSIASEPPDPGPTTDHDCDSPSRAEQSHDSDHADCRVTIDPGESGTHCTGSLGDKNWGVGCGNGVCYAALFCGPQAGSAGCTTPLNPSPGHVMVLEQEALVGTYSVICKWVEQKEGGGFDTFTKPKVCS